METIDSIARRAAKGRPAGGYRPSHPTTGFRSTLVNRFAVVPQKRAAAKRKNRQRAGLAAARGGSTFLGGTERTILT